MTYVVSLAELLTYQTPNFIWEYVKDFFCNHSYVKDGRLSIKHENVYETYKEEVALLLKAGNIGLNPERIKNLKDPPDWLNVDKIIRGQAFAKSYYFSISYSNLISLYLLFSHDRSLRPLILTKRSGDVEAAYKRYMSTIHRVKSWYEEDLTDNKSPSRLHIQRVNNYHLSIASKLNSMSEEEFVLRSTLDEEGMESINRCCERIRDVASNNEVDGSYLQEMNGATHLSQSHMMVTQFGFMGLILLYPEKFGITDTDDLDCFVHLWFYIGYLLGIEDEYNLCNGSVQQVRIKCKAVLECALKPCLLEVSSSWEHMSICACKGIDRALNKLNFETTLAYLMDCIDLNLDSFYYSMPLKARFKYHMIKFLFSYLITKSGTRTKLNFSVNKLLEKHKLFS